MVKKSFLDEIVILWCGTVERLHMFIKDNNAINPAIQVTLSHTVLASDLDATPNSLAFLERTAAC